MSAADKAMADIAREEGFEYTAQYIENFGASALNPSFFRGFSEQAEEFYKYCVLNGHPYDYFFEFPDSAIF